MYDRDAKLSAHIRRSLSMIVSYCRRRYDFAFDRAIRLRPGATFVLSIYDAAVTAPITMLLTLQMKVTANDILSFYDDELLLSASSFTRVSRTK